MADRRIYVDKNARTNGDGSIDAPFGTIEEAQEAARNAVYAGDTATVEIAPGSYFTMGLTFDNRDSGTTYHGADGAVLTGGIEVPYRETEVPDATVLSRLSRLAAAKVRMIDLKKYGVEPALYRDLYPIGAYHTAGKYDDAPTGDNIEVFEGSRRMTLARYPNDGYLKIEQVKDVGDAAEFPPQNYWKDWEKRRNHRGGTYIVDRNTNERMKTWKDPDTAWIFGYLYWDWADSSSPLAVVDTDNRAISPRYVSRYACRSGALYYFYNILEELDAPGEWYLDRNNGLLYVYPESADSTFSLSLTEKPLITFADAVHMTISGLTMLCTRTNALSGTGDDLTLDHLTIRNVGGYAVTLTGYRNMVRFCEISHTGRGGITLTGGDRTTLTPGENVAFGNYIHDFSEVYQTYQAGISLSGVGNRCAHNEIARSPHMAIGYGGNDHIIEYNDIHDVVYHSSDAGAIYSGYDWAGHGTIIRYNLLRNIGGEGFTPDGIYWDDGLSGQTAYGNILIDVRKFAFLIGGGRDNVVRDNIIIGESMQPILYDDRCRDGFINGGWFRQAVETPDAHEWRNLERVPYRSEIWAKKYPTLARITTSFAHPNDPNFPINPANSVVENNVIINADARFGQMAESVYTYNRIGDNYTYHSCAEAGFDRDTLTFRLTRYGFPPIQTAQIGRKWLQAAQES